MLFVDQTIFRKIIAAFLKEITIVFYNLVKS